MMKREGRTKQNGQSEMKLSLWKGGRGGSMRRCLSDGSCAGGSRARISRRFILHGGGGSSRSRCRRLLSNLKGLDEFFLSRDDHVQTARLRLLLRLRHVHVGKQLQQIASLRQLVHKGARLNQGDRNERGQTGKRR